MPETGIREVGFWARISLIFGLASFLPLFGLSVAMVVIFMEEFDRQSRHILLFWLAAMVAVTAQIAGIILNLPILSVVFIFGQLICGALALVSGLVSLSRENSRPRAVTGIILGCVGIIFMFSLILPSVGTGHPPSPEIISMGNLRNIDVALLVYAMEYRPEQTPPFDGAAGLELLRRNGASRQFSDNPEMFVEPLRITKRGRTYRHKVASPDTPLKEENVSYVYFGGIMEKYADAPVVFSKPEPGRTRLNVLFGNRKTESFRAEDEDGACNLALSG